jgi:alanine-alpha-ketoisovalerate/valine-pyruvate aminotransferase
MPSTSRKAYSRGFILTEQEFRRIHDIANTQIKKALIDKPYHIEFGLIYKNGVVNWRSDFESIFSEENIESSAVQSVSTHCFKEQSATQ